MPVVRVGKGFAAAFIALLVASIASAQSPLLQEIEQAFVSIGESVSPSVVTIEVRGTGEMGDQQRRMYEEFFKYFNVPMPEEGLPERQTSASGSGIIFDEQGHIVTNNHVVAGASSIIVTMADGSMYPASVVGSDADTDLAVIKLDEEVAVTPATLGDSDALKVGQFAVAVGTPRGLQGSLAFGHITALNRDDLNLPNLRFKQLIQTDAAINFGNSGGPLCNIRGQIVGINVAIAYDADSIGFAIPINRVSNIVPRLIAEGKISRGFLGVEIQDVDKLIDFEADMKLKDVLQSFGLPDGRGAHVNRTVDDSPAAKAGILNDDIIRKVNGVDVLDASDLMARIADYAPGSTVLLEVWRRREPVEVEVTLEEYAGSPQLAMAGNPILGMRLREIESSMVEQLGLEEGQAGLLVIDVEADSPAAKAGIERGSIILEIAQSNVTTVEDFRAKIAEFGEPGGSILLRVTKPGEQPGPKFLKIPEEVSEE